MYLLGTALLLFFNSSSFYFFLLLQSISLFALVHYFGGFSYKISSLCYVLSTLLSDVMIIYGFTSVSFYAIFFGFMLKLSFFPFLWFVPSILLNLPYSLVCFLVFLHKSLVVFLLYYCLLGLDFFCSFFILLSIFVSSIYLIINKGCLKSLLIWSSNIHCGWFLLLLCRSSYLAFSYIFIYLFFGLLAVFTLTYGTEYFYVYEVLGLDSSLGFWFWITFLFFCRFPPMLGWVLKFLIYGTISFNSYVVLVVLILLFSTFGYLVILHSFFVRLPSYRYLSLFFYLVPILLLLLGFFIVCFKG